MTATEADERPQLTGYFRFNPYDQSAARQYVAMTKHQLKCELSAFVLGVYQSLVTVRTPNSAISNQRSWTSGSASTVRLQCLVRDKRPSLYHAVIDSDEYRGTFQIFLSEVVRFQLFFYDGSDFEAFPSLKHLYNEHEGRCAPHTKGAALPKDHAVAEHWFVRFVPLDFTALTFRVAWDFKVTDSAPAPRWTDDQPDTQQQVKRGQGPLAALPGGNLSSEQNNNNELNGTGLRRLVADSRHARQLIDKVVAAAESELPFATIISKNRLKDAARETVRRVLPMITSLHQSDPSNSVPRPASLQIPPPSLCIESTFSIWTQRSVSVAGISSTALSSLSQHVQLDHQCVSSCISSSSVVLLPHVESFTPRTMPLSPPKSPADG